MPKPGRRFLEAPDVETGDRDHREVRTQANSKPGGELRQNRPAFLRGPEASLHAGFPGNGPADRPPGLDPTRQEILRKAGRTWWWRSYFKVFFLQGVILWIVAAPLLAAQTNPQPESLTWLDIVALLIWLIGFFFETVGDWQLVHFKGNSTNRGNVLNTGVWRYTRHPNYFGDAAHWWAYCLVAVAAGGWWTIFSPILMTVLLLRVSGVTLLEKTLNKEKPG